MFLSISSLLLLRCFGCGLQTYQALDPLASGAACQKLGASITTSTAGLAARVRGLRTYLCRSLLPTLCLCSLSNACSGLFPTRSRRCCCRDGRCNAGILAHDCNILLSHFCAQGALPFKHEFSAAPLAALFNHVW